MKKKFVTVIDESGRPDVAGMSREEIVTTLENCILGDDCTVGKGAVVRNAVLGDGTAVGPGETLDGDRVV